MRNWLLSLLCLLAMLGSGVATEARLLAEEPEAAVAEVGESEQASDGRVTTKRKYVGMRHSRLHHVARTGVGGAPTLALAATSWNWQPKLQFFTPYRPGRATTPFVRSILLSTSSLRAPPRG